jgi:hypothetical protein
MSLFGDKEVIASLNALHEKVDELATLFKNTTLGMAILRKQLIKPKRQPCQRITKKQIKDIQEQSTKGCKIGEIAHKNNLSYSQAFYWVKKLTKKTP